MKLSIVIPCYNESRNIPLLLDRFAEVLEDRDIEVILVNNGSTDDSTEILLKTLPKYPFAKTVSILRNKGYGFGILQGLKESSGEFIGWTHADMQTDPADIIKAWHILKTVQNQNIYIKGKREGRPWIDSFFTMGMSVFETLFFKEKMNDINAQPNIFPKSFYESWENPPYDFSLDLYAFYMAKKKNLKIFRFPVKFPERVHGESKWNTGLKSKWKFICRTVSFSRDLKKRL